MRLGEAHHRAAVNHGSIMKSIHKSKQFSEQLFSFFHVLIFQASNTCNGFVDRLHSIICATFQIFILFQKLTFSHFQQESGSLLFSSSTSGCTFRICASILLAISYTLHGIRPSMADIALVISSRTTLRLWQLKFPSILEIGS